MADVVQALMALWQGPPAADEDAERAFAEFYTDPVVVNGTPFTCADLAARARSLNRAFEGLGHQLLERIETPNRLVIAFLMTGRHVGPLPTALGEVAPTGKEVKIRTIDVLTFSAGRISNVVVVSDELGLLAGLDKVALKPTVGAS
ncbi:MAG TPA: ester cyclase [Kineosporiaceae bacterium]|nr:ester cyclase [Kineosporiaceae bacterium]